MKTFKLIQIQKKSKKSGDEIILSSNEQKLFFYLLERGGIVSRDEIMDILYDNPQNITSNSIDELIGRIRRKLNPAIIKTIKTRGYAIAL